MRQNMSKKRVVITGMGAISPIGNTVAQTWNSVRECACGIAPISLYDTTDKKVTLAAEVKNFVPEDHFPKKELRQYVRVIQFALVAAKEALAQANWTGEGVNLERCGVLVSSGIGSLSTTEQEHKRAQERGYDRVSPFYIPTSICNMPAGQVAILSGFSGMCSCPVTACAGGTNAVGDAFRSIRDGYSDAMLCGGTEAAITPLAVGGFTSMRALSTATDPLRASIPFDAERAGFVMGEGAAILLLEELEHAQKRGANIIAEVVGYGATCDAYHMTAPKPDGSGGARAMAQAIADAEVEETCVDYINAHGTSTPLNDSGETLAIQTVFGGHAKKLAVSSTKSMTGHMLGAAGAIEAIFSAMALHESFIPPTIGYKVPDSECDLDVVPNRGREQKLGYALSNSLGFGGHNASLLFKKWEGE